MNQHQIHERQLEQIRLDGHLAGYTGQHSTTNPHAGVATSKNKKWKEGWLSGRVDYIKEQGRKQNGHFIGKEKEL